MKCYVGLVTEFKDDFSPLEQDIIYKGRWRGIGGVSRESTGEAWIFVDNLAKYDTCNRDDIVVSIVMTVIHELIHLCGVDGEKEVEYGERAVLGMEQV